MSQCTWHTGGREVSRLTRGVTFCDVMRGNHVVEGGKDKQETKGKGDLSHQHRSEHETQGPQSEEENIEGCQGT